MITKQDLEDAPLFTAFRGQAEAKLTDEQWALFGIDGGRVSNDAVLAEAGKRGLHIACCAQTGMFMEPEFDEDWRDEVPDGCDAHAVLAYLNEGGMVAKLPDKMGEPYHRFYPILQAHTWYGDKDSDMQNPLMNQLAKPDPDEAQRKFVLRLYEYFDDLKEFDVKTGEVALFKESLESLQRVLPKALANEPLVVGSYLLKIMSSPSAAGLIIAEAWRMGRVS